MDSPPLIQSLWTMPWIDTTYLSAGRLRPTLRV